MKAKILTLFIGFIGMGGTLKAHTNTQKILVVYFSHSGNTKLIAEFIRDATGGDIFEIKTVKEYPTDYNAVIEQAEKEINANYKPELKTRISNIEKYDLIFVGSPNWWSTIAPPVSAFLSSYDLRGKIIVPFITHEGSRLGRSVADIKKLCTKSEVLNGYDCRGSNVKSAKDGIVKWIESLGILK